VRVVVAMEVSYLHLAPLGPGAFYDGLLEMMTA
jgi:hypothetical protein